MDENHLNNHARFTWDQIKSHFSSSKPFEARSAMGSALIRVREYQPLLALAVHAGHRVREELLSKMEIEEEERNYEEDLFVDELISEFPVQLIGVDSRYEYDVNRPRQNCVYVKPFQSWGKKVWRTPPTKEELEISYQKYDEFHELLEFVVADLTEKFGKSLVIDMHSYNFHRPNLKSKGGNPPVFNLAISADDRKKAAKLIDSVLENLRNIDIPGVPVTALENDVFIKDGAIAEALDRRFSANLVIPLEVKKIYVDERSGTKNADLTRRLAKALAEVGRAASEALMKA